MCFPLEFSFLFSMIKSFRLFCHLLVFDVLICLKRECLSRSEHKRSSNLLIYELQKIKPFLYWRHKSTSNIFVIKILLQLTFWNLLIHIPDLYSSSYHFCIPTSAGTGSLYPHHHWGLFLILCQSKRQKKWCLVVLICISLITN